MKKLLYALLSILVIILACSKEEQAPAPPPTPTFTLNFSADTGGTVSTEGGTYNQGSKITVTATPDGQFLFKEWSDGSTQNPREITVTSNLTLKASFIKKTYPLSVTIDGEGTVQEQVIIQGSTTETEYNAGTTVRLTATPNEGWEFSLWVVDGEVITDNPIEVSIEKGREATVFFKRTQFELNITIEGEGTVKEEVIVQPGQYDYETVVRLTAVPADGYEFSGWSGDVTSEENPIEVELKDTFEIRLTFTKNPPKITYPLHFESYHNQRSGVSFSWNDSNGFYSTLGEVKGYFAGGHAYHDVNNDGLQDILITYHETEDNPSVRWYIKNRGEGYTPSTDYFANPLVNLTSHKILKTDVDNNGLADFILLGVDEREQGNYGGNFTVLRQLNDGRFDIIGIDEGKGLWYHNGAAGDLNGDGYVDVIAADYIWYGDGTGNFTNSNFMLSENYAKDALVYEIVDINKDGYNDILLGTASYRESTTIILGSVNGFDSSNEMIKLVQLPESGPMDMEIYDIDEDGDLDIIESRHTEGQTTGYTELYVYINSSMTFQLVDNFIPDSKVGDYRHDSSDKYGWGSIKFDDIDGDGVDEIVAENYVDGPFNGLKKINGTYQLYSFDFE
jgi:hypothetical protein